MSSVLLSAFSFILVILAGMALRASGAVPAQAGDIAKTVLFNVTLPAAVIVNFSTIDRMSGQMLLLTLLGILVNVIMVIAGVIVTRKRSKESKALHILCLPAYNIGAFCLPFVQNFLPALGTVSACMFDVGNSIMCTGATYAFAAEYVSESKKGFDLKAVGKRLLSSVSLMTYVVMFFLSLLHIRLPEAVLTLISPMAQSNAFVAMLMIGLMFRIDMKREYFADIVRILGIRHIFAVIFACVIFYVLPFDTVIKQTLILIAFGPLSAAAPAFTGMCGGDEGRASAANSISIILSIAEMTALLLLLGIY